MADTILRPDLCIVGGGAAGLSVAAAGAAMGASVVLVERGRMGGECLNAGCVPSKALIAAARRAHHMRGAAAFGIAGVEPQVNFRRVHDHVHGVIADIAPTDSAARFRALGVTVIEDEATFIDRRTLAAGGTKVRARRFVLATGSVPAMPAIAGLGSVAHHTSESIFSITRKPAHLCVLGAGAVGLELAQAFRRLGSEVTVLEPATPLALEDPELAGVALEALARDGVRLRTGVSVKSVQSRGSGVRLVVETPAGEEILDASDLLVAAGRRPVTEGLGLDKAGISHGPGGIVVNARLRTTNRRTYALGDVAAGAPRFTHVAAYQAGIVVRNTLFRLRAKAHYGHVPHAVYTDPEIARVGMTEAEARERHSRIRILRWPLAENDRARAERETGGLVKIVTDRKGRILGAGIAGANAGELIQPWALAMSRGLGIRAMAEVVVPYPTLGEAGKRAAGEFFRSRLTSPAVRRIIGLLRLLG